MLNGFSVKSALKEISFINENLKKSFKKIKDEFEDHLEAINENTNEINSNYEYLCEIDAKIQKISERLDELQMMVMRDNHPQQSFAVKTLTFREKEVFLALYTLTEEKEAVTLEDIGRRTGLTVQLVKEYMENIITKGVPILERTDGDKMYVKLDRAFREMQAKHNIIEIREGMVKNLVA